MSVGFDGNFDWPRNWRYFHSLQKKKVINYIPDVDTFLYILLSEVYVICTTEKSETSQVMFSKRTSLRRAEAKNYIIWLSGLSLQSSYGFRASHIRSQKSRVKNDILCLKSSSKMEAQGLENKKDILDNLVKLRGISCKC